MKNLKNLPVTRLRTILSSFLILLVTFSFAGGDNLDDDINLIRKGEIRVVAAPGESVTIEQLSHEFWFGCAISNGMFTTNVSGDDARIYREKFLENFNSAVTENALKWGSMEPRKGQPDFSVIDNILLWTEENGIPLRGHNLFWGIDQFVQPWVKELDDKELERTIKDRARTITRKYKGRFAEYDLNNEMVHGNYYEERLGKDITKKMAKWAHEGDKAAKLYLNDYDILTGRVLPAYLQQIRELLAQGVPVAGIGVQGHLHGETFDRMQLKNALDSLEQFGLPVKVTEFNMPGQRSRYYTEKIRVMTPAEEELKAKELVDYYRICFAHPSVDGILMWGFWAGANWIPVSSLYRQDWSPTPAAKVYQDLVFREWWTSEKGSADGNGNFTSRGFFGKYRITVGNQTREIDLSKDHGSVVVDMTRNSR